MKFEESIESGVHAHLSVLVGEWKGPAKTWFEPDVVGDESPMTGRMKARYGSRKQIIRERFDVNRTDKSNDKRAGI